MNEVTTLTQIKSFASSDRGGGGKARYRCLTATAAALETVPLCRGPNG
jgi:hypothetical protein